ncbi:red chlorophyll catabolite reductase, chloroplastic-like [Cannabis sativa]|nr:red chlorophyll catabolite reductase, chloroplastic-like [Cannabis sativa]KAF4349489.1 hypothetical protein F8388_008432 [Cannabis sativa]
MVVFTHHQLQSRFSTTPFHMKLDDHNDNDEIEKIMMKKGRKAFMEFPYVSSPQKKLMVDLVSTVENGLNKKLLPSTLPPNVQYYQNQTNTTHASLHIRSGKPSSHIDFIYGGWIHRELPNGGALNITSLSAYLNASTNSPNFLLEIIRSSPETLVLILDLPPRKDLALYPDYLQKFYEDTELDAQRQILEKIPEVKPYFSSSLYFRRIVSPTAIVVKIESEAGERIDEIIEEHVDLIAKRMLQIWLEKCIVENNEKVDEIERMYLLKRDKMVRSKTIEIEFSSSLPYLFGPEIANRVWGTVQKYFSTS